MADVRRINVNQHPWYRELHELEMEMLDPEVRADVSRLNLLIRNDFVEIGSSGRVYHKKMLIDMLINERRAAVVIRDFAIRELSPEAALITYRTLGQGGQEARRSSIWSRSKGRWQMVFHQGTRIASSWGPLR